MARNGEGESSNGGEHGSVRVWPRADPFLIVFSRYLMGFLDAMPWRLLSLWLWLRLNGASFSSSGSVAVMTRAFHNTSGEHELVLLQNIGSCMLLDSGVIYIMSGLLCFAFLIRARQTKEVTRDQAVRDLEELERRREELRPC